MAEAAVEERPPPRFYCHMCNVQFQHASSDFTCPHCSDGFIEELQDNPTSDSYPADDWDFEPMEFASNDSSDRLRPSRLRHMHRADPRSRYARLLRPRPLTRLASSNLPQSFPSDTLIQEYIINLGVGVNWGTAGNMQLFLGNPGDYAWGREGLDAIVTQLLNQMDNTGPPPVSRDVIDAITVVEVSEEHVGEKKQCSVCWEDFLLKENVRQLPCFHIYHESCIRPWLELHGTCPICRKNLNGDDTTQAGETQEATSTTSQARNVQNLLIELFGNNEGSDAPSSSSTNDTDARWRRDSADSM